jgi:hypothetical protein
MTMRITNPTALAAVAGTQTRGPRRGKHAAKPRLLRRVNAYTLWAFNPQRELTSRYDRAA